MKFAVIAEETSYDHYDETYDPTEHIEVVEVPDGSTDQDAIKEVNLYLDAPSYYWFAYQVEDDEKIGERYEKPSQKRE